MKESERFMWRKIGTLPMLKTASASLHNACRLASLECHGLQVMHVISWPSFVSMIIKHRISIHSSSCAFDTVTYVFRFAGFLQIAKPFLFLFAYLFGMFMFVLPVGLRVGVDANSRPGRSGELH